MSQDPADRTLLLNGSTQGRACSPLRLGPLPPEADYGWSTDRPEPGHAWFDRPVLELCARVKPATVLDLGCGNGALARRLVEAGYDVTGCDPDESGIRIARRAVPEARFHVCGVYDDFGRLGDGPFDLVVSSEVIEHLFLPRYLPRFAHSALRPGGWLIVTTPYYGYLRNLMIAIGGRWDAHHGVFWDCGHIKFWSRKTLTRLLREEGFAVRAFRGAGRLPWLWNTMILLAQKI